MLFQLNFTVVHQQGEKSEVQEEDFYFCLWINGLLFFLNFTFEPSLSLDDMRNFSLTPGKREDRSCKASFYSWPCLSFVAISGYKYAPFICYVSIGYGFPMTFQVW